MSASPPKADMCGATKDVRFGSKADICSAKWHVCFTPDCDNDCVFRHVRWRKADMSYSIDHLVVETVNKYCVVDVDRFCRIVVDEKLKFRWLLDVQIGRLCSL